MNAVNIIIASAILIISISGCSNKQFEPKVEYIYKTKIEYVYLPCKNQIKENSYASNAKYNAEANKSIKSKATNLSMKHKPKYKQPKLTKIYAPKKYVTRANKEMDFMVGINRDGSEFVYMEGEFGANTYNNFIKFLNKANTDAKEIKISSNGGLVSTAMQIGSYVHERSWDTGVDKEMHCFSACSFVYFAGKEKSLEGKAMLGLHRPYIPGVKDTASSIRKVKSDYISYWNYIRAPKSLYDEMMEVDRDNLFILNSNNINDYIDVKIK